MKILLAEDDPNVRVITQLCLEKIGGHEVTVAIDGEEALLRTRAESFDLLLLDGMMPKRGGLQVAKEVRADEHANKLGGSAQQATPIIFLSAKSEAKDVAEFLQFGSGYIAKPFDPQSICRRIDEALLEMQQKAA